MNAEKTSRVKTLARTLGQMHMVRVTMKIQHFATLSGRVTLARSQAWRVKLLKLTTLSSWRVVVNSWSESVSRTREHICAQQLSSPWTKSATHQGAKASLGLSRMLPTVDRH